MGPMCLQHSVLLVKRLVGSLVPLRSSCLLNNSNFSLPLLHEFLPTCQVQDSPFVPGLASEVNAELVTRIVHLYDDKAVVLDGGDPEVECAGEWN